jgi:hypothetical protein
LDHAASIQYRFSEELKSKIVSKNIIVNELWLVIDGSQKEYQFKPLLQAVKKKCQEIELKYNRVKAILNKVHLSKDKGKRFYSRVETQSGQGNPHNTKTEILNILSEVGWKVDEWCHQDLNNYYESRYNNDRGLRYNPLNSRIFEWMDSEDLSGIRPEHVIEMVNFIENEALHQDELL